MNPRVRPGKANADTAAMRALLNEVMTRLCDLVVGTGISSGEFASSATDAARELRREPPPVPPDALGCVLFAAHALTFWHNEPQYLDRYARPKPLLREGDNSLEELVTRACPSVNPASIIAHLHFHKIIVRRGRYWRPTRDAVKFIPDTPEQRLHGLVILRGLLRTLDQNAAANGKANAFFELHAKNGNIPVGDRQLVLRNARTRGKKFLESLDIDMKRRERPELPAAKKTHLSVGVYVYEEDLGSVTASNPLGVVLRKARRNKR
jgi:hypothetical protein